MQAKDEAEGMKEAEPSAVIEGEGQNLRAECGKVGWWIVEQEEERPGERILLPHKGGNTFHMQKKKKTHTNQSVTLLEYGPVFHLSCELWGGG